MAKFVKLHNGRLKVVRNRFGGDHHRDGLREGCAHQRTRLSRRIHHLEMLEGCDSIPARVTHSEAVAQVCPVSNLTMPVNGKVAFIEGETYVTLIYREGSIASALITPVSRISAARADSLFLGSVEFCD